MLASKVCKQLSRLCLSPAHARCLVSPSLTSSLHTSAPAESRIKKRAVHKGFWHIKKTNKQQDDPITISNQDFLQEMKELAFSSPKIPPPPSFLSPDPSQSPLRAELQPWPKGQWNERSTRTGLIGRKIGVVPLWLKSGKKVMSTMVQIEDNHVIKYIPREEYLKTLGAQKRMRPQVYHRTKPVSRGVLVVGALSADPSSFTKDYCGLFTSCGLAPKKKLCRFPVSDDAVVQPGTRLRASHFQAGQHVDIMGRGVRRGFQGVMKRWGFAGMPSGAWRGVTKSHRRPGCIGSGRDKGRVWPGQKMPGHMGGNRVRMLGLKILRINHEHDILYLKGQAVPGWPGEFVQIFDSKLNEKRLTNAPRFFPTFYESDRDSLPPEGEEYDEKVHRFQDPSIAFEDDGKKGTDRLASKTKAKTAAGKKK